MLGQLNEDEIEALLHREVMGRLGCHAAGRTYIVPITYAYADGLIVARSAEGQKLQMLRENSNVCFEVDHVVDLNHWQSVIIWGRFEELRGAAADHAMMQLLARILPLGRGTDATQTAKSLTHQNRALTQGVAAVVFCIHIDERTGRFES